MYTGVSKVRDESSAEVEAATVVSVAGVGALAGAEGGGAPAVAAVAGPVWTSALEGARGAVVEAAVGAGLGGVAFATFPAVGCSRVRGGIALRDAALSLPSVAEGTIVGAVDMTEVVDAPGFATATFFESVDADEVFGKGGEIDDAESGLRCATRREATLLGFNVLSGKKPSIPAHTAPIRIVPSAERQK